LTWLTAGRRRIRPGRNLLLDGRSFSRISLKTRDYIHPIQRVQVIKMHHVIMHVLLGDHQVTNQIGGFGNFDSQGVFYGTDGGKRMHRSADAAGALGEGAQASRGSRPRKIFSMPRTIVPEE
jgi:hypothetical protein